MERKIKENKKVSETNEIERGDLIWLGNSQD